VSVSLRGRRLEVQTAEWLTVAHSTSGRPRLAGPYATDFKFSRFDAAGAVAPRDAAAMRSGKVGTRKRAPPTPAAGFEHAVDGLNFVGSDLRGMRGPKTAQACYRACEKTKGCAAFTFITSASPTAPKSKCWLKKEGFAAGGEYSAGTMSGVVRRVG